MIHSIWNTYFDKQLLASYDKISYCTINIVLQYNSISPPSAAPTETIFRRLAAIIRRKVTKKSDGYVDITHLGFNIK